MIESIARAIAQHENNTDWHDHVPAARAALAVLLEPSTEMLTAALPDGPDWGYLPEEWRSMILHVLNEDVPH